MNRMAKKKQKNQNWIGGLIGFGIGGTLGLWIVRFTELRGGVGFGAFMGIMLILLLWMYFCMFLHIIIHEAGHLLAGLLSGYHFSSFRIGSFAWVKRDGKVHFCRYSLAGTGGQCLMVPPEMKDGKMPAVLYNLGGILINIATALLCMIPAIRLPQDTIGHGLWFVASFTGFASALMNGLPVRIGMVDNDGRNTIAIRRNPAALRAFWVQMMVAYRIAQGDRMKELPEQWFDCPVRDLNNSLIAAVWVYRTNQLMDRQAFAQAEEAIDDLLQEESLMGLFRASLMADKLFCMMLRGADRCEIDALYTKEQKQMMAAMRTNPSVIRTQYAYAVLVSRDAKEAEKQRTLFEKVAEKYPYPQEIESERELLAKVPTQQV